MTIEIKVPVLPESVTDATVAKWYKKVGDSVVRSENLVDLETDKVMLEVPAPNSGVIESILVKEGDVVTGTQVIATIREGEAAAASTSASAEKAPEKPAESTPASSVQQNTAAGSAGVAGPGARRAATEKGVDTAQVSGTGVGGRITKEDVAKHTPGTAASMMSVREEKRVPMSRLRQRIAERLVDVQHQAAILTTFNEINMKPVMDLRAKYKDQFEKTHGTRLGFMSFFTKAAVAALKLIPAVNASIDGNDIIYHNYFDIGIAVSSPRGLVVPVIRDADLLSMAHIEEEIREYGNRAKEAKLTMEEMTGGTFTITNGGVFGSMLSTPIINAPQSAILGMHNIVERPVVENGEIVIRPIMYVALSYDHRIIDGRESVTFLKTIKELVEDPARLLLEV